MRTTADGPNVVAPALGKWVDVLGHAAHVAVVDQNARHDVSQYRRRRRASSPPYHHSAYLICLGRVTSQVVWPV